MRVQNCNHVNATSVLYPKGDVAQEDFYLTGGENAVLFGLNRVRKECRDGLDFIVLVAIINTIVTFFQ